MTPLGSGRELLALMAQGVLNLVTIGLLVGGLVLGFGACEEHPRPPNPVAAPDATVFEAPPRPIKGFMREVLEQSALRGKGERK